MLHDMAPGGLGLGHTCSAGHPRDGPPLGAKWVLNLTLLFTFFTTTPSSLALFKEFTRRIGSESSLVGSPAAAAAYRDHENSGERQGRAGQ